MIRKVLVVIAAALFSCNCYAQKNIKETRFTGIEKTKPEYLKYFIHSLPGAALDSSQLEIDRQNLANLEILSNAKYEVIEQNDGYTIIFDCKELYSFLPILNFGGIKENIWFVAGFTHVNLSGKGNKLTSYYQYYDRHSLSTTLQFDFIRGSPWGTNLYFVKWSTLEPLYFENGTVNYNYDNYTYGADGIYHFNLNNSFLFGGSYFTEEYKAVEGLVEGAPAEFKTSKTLFKFRYDHNKINYFYFYQSGIQFVSDYQVVYSLDGDPTFHIVFNTFKYFKRIGYRGNLASRLKFGLSSNQDSPFAPFVLDSYVNIRGVGNRVDRGTGQLVSNIEYRHAVYDGNSFAVQGVVFSDLGTWRQPGGSFHDFIERENVVWFGGLGARLIHKKIFNAVLRFDYGFNLGNPAGNGFVLGIGQYF
jgi:hypothetical protein